MIRHCDGTDPNLIRYDPPWDPTKPPSDYPAGAPRPCDCGIRFDDVRRMVIHPHPKI